MSTAASTQRFWPGTFLVLTWPQIFLAESLPLPAPNYSTSSLPLLSELLQALENSSQVLRVGKPLPSVWLPSQSIYEPVCSLCFVGLDLAGQGTNQASFCILCSQSCQTLFFGQELCRDVVYTYREPAGIIIVTALWKAQHFDYSSQSHISPFIPSAFPDVLQTAVHVPENVCATWNSTVSHSFLRSKLLLLV